MPRLPKKVIEVPFDSKGNQLSYPEWEWKHDPTNPMASARGYVHIEPTYVPNFEFDATLVFDRIEVGRSAVRFHFKDLATQKGYVMFLGDAEPLIKKLDHGTIRGRWTFRKQGANFGCIPVENEVE